MAKKNLINNIEPRSRKKIIPCQEIGEKFNEFKEYVKDGVNDESLKEKLCLDENALDQLKMLLALEQCGQLYTNRTIYRKYFRCAPPKSIFVTKSGIVIKANKIEELGAQDVFSENTEIFVTFEDNKIVISKM